MLFPKVHAHQFYQADAKNRGKMLFPNCMSSLIKYSATRGAKLEMIGYADCSTVIQTLASLSYTITALFLCFLFLFGFGNVQSECIFSRKEVSLNYRFGCLAGTISHDIQSPLTSCTFPEKYAKVSLENSLSAKSSRLPLY